MSNLTTISNPTIQNLPFALQSFAKVRIGCPQYKALSPIDKTAYCLEVITRAHASVGDKGEDVDLLTFQTHELEYCLKEKYGELTIQEISRVLEMLIAGEFGQFFGLNKKSYYQALKGYYELPERSQAMLEFLRISEPKPSELTPEEKMEKSKKALIWYFVEYKKNRKLSSGSYTMYQSLWDLGVLKFSSEEIQDITETAQKNLEKYDLDQPNKNKAKFIGAILKEKPTLKSEQRKEALKRYFDKLIKEGIELETIIK